MDQLRESTTSSAVGQHHLFEDYEIGDTLEAAEELMLAFADQRDLVEQQEEQQEHHEDYSSLYLLVKNRQFAEDHGGDLTVLIAGLLSYSSRTANKEHASITSTTPWMPSLDQRVMTPSCSGITTLSTDATVTVNERSFVSLKRKSSFSSSTSSLTSCKTRKIQSLLDPERFISNQAQ
jgi:hypothetical protein